ncbi:MAG: hypothetical protein OXF09_00920 [Hyphomicrobiales bacterium]|nr:hypothetical protein [Hyphomicrobiales bacterium]
MLALLRHPLFYMLLAGALLSGCGAIYDHYQHKDYDQTCQQQGWAPDTQEYDECIEELKQGRSKKEMPESFLDSGWWIGTWF